MTKANRPRGIYLLPNILTIGSFFAGFFAIITAFQGAYESAAISIFIAMIMDNLDGRIARLTNTITLFGAELDSLADMVSFAIAPACLAYSCGLHLLHKFGWLSAFIYTVAVALRLARFNSQLEHEEKRYFQGLPCPIAAAVVTSFIWSAIELKLLTNFTIIILAVLMILSGLLMVSNIRFRSFKDLQLNGNVRFFIILMIVPILVLISYDPAKILFLFSTSYVIFGLIATVWSLHRKRQLRQLLHKQHQEELNPAN